MVSSTLSVVVPTSEAIHWTAPLLFTFGLLALSICSVWLAPLQVRQKRALPVWPFLFVGAIAAGLSFGYLRLSAILSLGVLVLAAFLATQASVNRAAQAILTTLSVLMALALALHQFPGFNNPTLIANVKFSADAAPFTQFVNFDKGAAGLVLLAFFCARANASSQWREMFGRTYPIVLTTAAVVIGVSLVMGQIRPDVKLPSYAPVFLAINLFFTCVAEEAFFRGLLQDRLAKNLATRHFRGGGLIAVACCALLFGLAHAAGGPWYVLVSTLAGLGYGYAYAAVQRIEAPILVHFAVNAVHFLGFTYPRIG
jgi:uncharacterized protein